ncbi:hypothetical protein ACFYTQ_06100 [Nocardia sp. NPDC004068]|uniref:DUF7144 family membrane protein n=1 Tax=Nocardia sp. NPDC004068 TaxID=3364303 RepID=UPI0036B0B2AB
MTTYLQEPHPVRQGFAAGITMFAAVLLLIGGIMSVLQGISAVVRDEVFLRVPEYSYRMDLPTWGWVHIVLGALAILVALAMMIAARWALILAAVVAAVSIVANFLSLPYAPWWSVATIVVDLVVLWAVSTWRPYAPVVLEPVRPVAGR